MALPVYLIHYEAEEWVRSAAASILASDIPVQLTVVSNSGPVEVPNARVIETGGNLGYAGAGNCAFRDWLATDEPFVVVGSHDLHLEPDALRLLREAMETDGNAGIVGPSMPDAWAGEERDGGRAWLSGQALMYRRRCIEEIGGFDERFGSYTEDREIGLRAWDHGWKVIRVDAARGHGLGSAAGRRAARRRYWANWVGLAYKREGVPGAIRALASHVANTARALRIGVRARRVEKLIEALDRVRCLPLCFRQVARFAFTDAPPLWKHAPTCTPRTAARSRQRRDREAGQRERRA